MPSSTQIQIISQREGNCSLQTGTGALRRGVVLTAPMDGALVDLVPKKQKEVTGTKEVREVEVMNEGSQGSDGSAPRSTSEEAR